MKIYFLIKPLIYEFGDFSLIPSKSWENLLQDSIFFIKIYDFILKIMLFTIFKIFMIFRKCRKLWFSLICHFHTSGPFPSKKLRKLGARHGVEVQIGAIFNCWFRPDLFRTIFFSEKYYSFNPLFGYLGPSGFEKILVIMLAKIWQSLVQIGLNWTYFKRFFIFLQYFQFFCENN